MSRARCVAPAAALTASYAPAFKASMAAAHKEARQAGCTQVQPHHLVLGLLEMECQSAAGAGPAGARTAAADGGSMSAVFEQFGLSKDHVREVLLDQAGAQQRDGSSGSPTLSEQVTEVLTQARRAARMQGADIVAPNHLLWALLQLPRHSSTNPLIKLAEDPAVKLPSAVWAALQEVVFAPWPSEQQQGSLVASVANGSDPTDYATSPTTSMLCQLMQRSIPDMPLRDLAQALSLLPSLHVAPGQDVISAIQHAINERQASFSWRFEMYSSLAEDLAAWAWLLAAAKAAGIVVPLRQPLTEGLLCHLSQLLLSESTLRQGLDLMPVLVWHHTLTAYLNQHGLQTGLPDALRLAEARLDDCSVLAEAMMQVPEAALKQWHWDSYGNQFLLSEPDMLLTQLLRTTFQKVYHVHTDEPVFLSIPLVSLAIEVCSRYTYLNHHFVQLQLGQKLEQLTEGEGALTGANLGLKGAVRLLVAAVSSHASLSGCTLVPAANIGRDSFRSHQFGPQEAFLAITSLQQLRHDPSPTWLFGFLLQLRWLMPLMTPAQLSATIHALGSFPTSKTVLCPVIADVLMQATVQFAVNLDPNQRVAIMQGLIGLGLRQRLWSSEFAQYCLSTTTQSASPPYHGQVFAPILAMMAEYESDWDAVWDIVGLPDDAPPPSAKSGGLFGGSLPSSTALLCQALTQQYFEQQDASSGASSDADSQFLRAHSVTSTLMSWVSAAAADPAASSSGRGRDSSSARSLTSTLMSWVAAAAPPAAKSNNNSAVGTPVPDQAAVSALLSSSLGLPLSPRQALLMAWAAAVLGLQPPPGWVEAMWERVRPAVQAAAVGKDEAAGSLGGLLKGDRALAIWAFNALHQATTQSALLHPDTLPPPASSGPLALSSTLWALAQAKPVPPLALPGAAADSLPRQWRDQAAAALIAALCTAVTSQGKGSGEVGAQSLAAKACVSGLLSLGVLGYRAEGGREEEAKEESEGRKRAVLSHCRAILAWASKASKAGGEGAAAAAEVQAALAAVGVQP